MLPIWCLEPCLTLRGTRAALSRSIREIEDITYERALRKGTTAEHCYANKPTVLKCSTLTSGEQKHNMERIGNKHKKNRRWEIPTWAKIIKV